MRLIPLVLGVLLLPSSAALADCQDGIASAMSRANALPPTAGRAALLEQIQRADVARHEDDAEGCAEELRDAVGVLDEIDAAKKRAASGAAPAAVAHDEPPKAASKP